MTSYSSLRVNNFALRLQNVIASGGIITITGMLYNSAFCVVIGAATHSDVKQHCIIWHSDLTLRKKSRNNDQQTYDFNLFKPCSSPNFNLIINY